MSTQILKWLGAIGNSPLVEPSKQELLERLKHRHEKKQEELDKQLEALEAGDLLDYFDGILDEQVYWVQDVLDLEHAGFNVNEGLHTVITNNLSKLTTSQDNIYRQHALLVQKAGFNDWYVDSNEFDGQTYHCLKRHDNDKITKWADHVKPDLKQHVPNKYLTWEQLHGDAIFGTGNALVDIKSEDEYDEVVAQGLGEVIYKDFPKSYEELLDRKGVE